MKKIILASLLLITSTIVFAQTNWVTQKVDDKLSIKFPGKPEVAEQAGMFAATFESDTKVKYVLNTMDFAALGLDSATLTPMLETEEFSGQLIGGMKGKMEGFDFSEVKTEKWKGFTYFSLDATNKEKKVKMYFKILFIGSKMYNMLCAYPDGVAPDTKDTFFNSTELL